MPPWPWLGPPAPFGPASDGPAAPPTTAEQAALRDPPATYPSLAKGEATAWEAEYERLSAKYDSNLSKYYQRKTVERPA